MAFIYEKYKPEIDKCVEDIRKIIQLYNVVLTKDPKDSYAEKKQRELYTYLNEMKKELRDLPNSDEGYIKYISKMKEYFLNAQDEYDKTYAGKLRPDATKEDAKKALIKAIDEFQKLIKRLTDFNNQYKSKGNHTDNYACVKLINELKEKVMKYESESLKEEKPLKPNYDKYIYGLNIVIEYYKKLVESTIRDQKITFS